MDHGRSPKPQIWQLQWHGILNDYPNPEGGGSITPGPLPDLPAAAIARSLAREHTRRTRTQSVTRGTDPTRHLWMIAGARLIRNVIATSWIGRSVSGRFNRA
jgi:hypothetical protein